MTEKARDAVTLFLAGDAIMTRPWSDFGEPEFLKLVEEIRAADVSIVNLETVIHEFKGFAQNDSGGIHLASPPEVAADLKWAGFDMVAHANNHAFDYGSSAILETLDHVGKAGLLIAGSGKDLQEARAPRYFSCGAKTVALVAMTSTLAPYGRASRSRPDLHGRPGVNPLALTPRESAVVVPVGVADRIRAFGRLAGRNPEKMIDGSFRVGLRFHVGRRFGFERARRLNDRDREANLAAIAEAAARADFVVVSLHAHSQGRWLRDFVRDAVRAGADVVFIQGPHRVGAVELCDGKPIFHSMGDFVYETANIVRFPSDAYEKVQLGDDASPRDLTAKTRERRGNPAGRREAFEGLAAVLSLEAGGASKIRLIPVDLQFDAPATHHGRPQWAAPRLGKQIVETVARRSRRYGTRIRYDAAANCGIVEIPVRTR